jgi:molybdopterin molybdotransferase
MLSVKEAVYSLLQDSERLVGQESVELIHACGRTLAAGVTAPIDVPPADNSAMDGYALRRADWENEDHTIPVSQRITAGLVPQALTPGSAARIFTGAEVPTGADTVVMQEHCEQYGDAVRILKMPAAGANIRRRGQDLFSGQPVLREGQRLRPQDLGLAASLGLATVPVYRPLKVAIMSTGDELRDPGDELQPGQIYNSNRYIMKAQLEAWGFEVLDIGIARDDPAAVRELMLKAASMADLVMTSGGVSVGEEDHVKAVVESLGSIDLWRIAIKPGKPFAFGRIAEKPFIGLPGNPVSVFATLLVIARPYLFACQGITDSAVHPGTQTALFNQKASQREDYLRVRACDRGVELFPNQSSGVLFSTTWGDGLVRQKSGEEIREGSPVDYLPFAAFN